MKWVWYKAKVFIDSGLRDYQGRIDLIDPKDTSKGYSAKTDEVRLVDDPKQIEACEWFFRRGYE